MKIDGRHAGNSAMAVLSRLAGEIAYSQKRLCLRDEPQVKQNLERAMSFVEASMGLLESKQNDPN